MLQLFSMFSRPGVARDVLETALLLADLGEARGCSINSLVTD